MFILRTLWTLFIVFFVLKVTGNIGWNWGWVFSPIVPPVAIYLFFLTYYMFENKKDSYDRGRDKESEE